MIIDVSVPLRQPMPTYPGDAPFELIPVVRMAEGGVCNGSRLMLGTHSGTHIDAPWHFNDAGKRIHEIPLARLIGACWVADLRGYPHITADALERANIPPTPRACCSRPTTARSGGRRTSSTRHMSRSLQMPPSGSSATASMSSGWTTSPSNATVRRPKCIIGSAAAGKVIIEGLNLSAVDAGEYELLCMPLLIEGADGAPARVALRTLR
jgi:arylformamidase